MNMEEILNYLIETHENNYILKNIVNKITTPSNKKEVISLHNRESEFTESLANESIDGLNVLLNMNFQKEILSHAEEIPVYNIKNNECQDVIKYIMDYCKENKYNKIYSSFNVLQMLKTVSNDNNYKFIKSMKEDKHFPFLGKIIYDDYEVDFYINGYTLEKGVWFIGNNITLSRNKGIYYELNDNNPNVISLCSDYSFNSGDIKFLPIEERA